MLADWHDFFITAATCAATLTGLITVGVSIGLKKILHYPKLPDKALTSILVLLTTLLVALLGLVPGQPLPVLGAEFLGGGLLGWGATSWLTSRSVLATPVAYRRKQWLDMGLLQVAMLPYLAAGGWLLAGRPAGLYWLVPALLLSLCKATLDAWVLLIEIHR